MIRVLTPLITAVGVLLGSHSLADTPIGDLQQFPGVRVTGTVTHVFGNELVLQDASGSVLVDTGPEWFKRHSFSVGETISVIGEMDDGDFDAYSIQRADGTTLVIRPRSGPPPWSDGR